MDTFLFPGQSPEKGHEVSPQTHQAKITSLLGRLLLEINLRCGCRARALDSCAGATRALRLYHYKNSPFSVPHHRVCVYLLGVRSRAEKWNSTLFPVPTAPLARGSVSFPCSSTRRKRAPPAKVLLRSFNQHGGARSRVIVLACGRK